MNSGDRFDRAIGCGHRGIRSETVTLGDFRLHLWVGGELEARPSFLWNGFPATGYMWREVAPCLARAGLVPNMRECGGSDKPQGTEEYDAGTLAEACRALVEEIGFGKGQPVVLAGDDMVALPARIWAVDRLEETAEGGVLHAERP